MKKAIATSTLFKIVLGLLVFVLIVFLFYITFKDKWLKEECNKLCLSQKLARCANRDIGWGSEKCSCGDESQFTPGSAECIKILGTSS